MFRNFKLAILAFYVVTVLLLVGGLYYGVIVLGIDNLFVILLSTAVITLLSGFAIAKMAIEPLQEHFTNLENFSKETLHELNLPISTIMANTSMLKRTHADEKSLVRIGRIEAASAMLQERYGELDYLIRQQMHREVIEMFDLSELIAERLELLRSLYPQVQFRLDLEPFSLKMDRMGLRKVLDNLIDNAVKYSGGKGEVALRLRERLLEVQDFGSGMDEVELFQIFDRYYQSDASMPGFGIGLGLVKSFCDKHRIKLHVQSQKGEGTTMILDFKGVE